jgi:hypothetical protein
MRNSTILSTFLLKQTNFHRVPIVKLPKLKPEILAHPIYGSVIKYTTIYRGSKILFLHQKISERRVDTSNLGIVGYLSAG